MIVWQDVFFSLGIKGKSLFNKVHNYTTMTTLILEALCLTGSEKVSILLSLSDSVRSGCPVQKYYNTVTDRYSLPYL